MTKIGDGQEPIHPETVKEYRNQLLKSSGRFQRAMDAYVEADRPEEKARLKAIMQEQLALIRAAVREIRRTGLEKESVQLEEDYQKFIHDPRGENQSALVQDLETLREGSGGEYPPAFGIRG